MTTGIARSIVLAPIVVALWSIAGTAVGQETTVRVVPAGSDTSTQGADDSNRVTATSADVPTSSGSIPMGASTTVVVTAEPAPAPPPEPVPPATTPPAARRMTGPGPQVPTAPPFVIDVEQVIALAPPEWELLEMRQLEARLVNAPDDAARRAVAEELAMLRARVEHDRAVLLLGRIRGSNAPSAAVLVPSGNGGSAIASGSSVRVTPLDAPFPAAALGEATRAFPFLRTCGSANAPGYVAAMIEPAGAASAARSAAAAAAPAPWARRTATSLPESSNLVVDGTPEPGPVVNGLVPTTLTVRNAGTQSLPPSEVFFEFMDASGDLIHREFRWITPQRSEAFEATLPALAPGDRTVIETPIPPAVAERARSARVLIVRLLPRTPGSRR